MKQGICHYDVYLRPPQIAVAEQHNPSLIEVLIAKLGLWIRRSRSRRDLANLSHEQLLDVGISSDEAQREVEKPFWLQ